MLFGRRLRKNGVRGWIPWESSITLGEDYSFQYEDTYKTGQSLFIRENRSGLCPFLNAVLPR